MEKGAFHLNKSYIFEQENDDKKGEKRRRKNQHDTRKSN